MKFFLDSAKIDEIKYAMDMWAIDGVTSNPRHIRASGKSFMTAVHDLAKVSEGTELSVSVEVNPHHDTAQAMYDEGSKIYKIAPKNFVVKLPCTEAGFKALRMFEADDVPCNLTLCFNAVQALQAARLGAKYISPFVGWKEDNGDEAWGFIEDIVQIYENFNYDTEVLVAAARSGRHIVEAATMGADIVTAGFEVYKAAFKHPYTPEGLARFSEAWDATPYE